MKSYEIIVMVLWIIWIISMPYLKKIKIYNFCVLMMMPFIISYLVLMSIQAGNFTTGSVWLFVLFLADLIYQAIQFYRTYLNE
jgi:hypothetical protein